MKAAPHRERSSRLPVAVVLGLVLLLAACSSGNDEAATIGADDVADTDEGAAGDGEQGERAGDDAAEPGEPLSIGAPLGRKVIQRADLTLEVDDPAAVVDEITSLAERSGGFVAGAELRRTGRDDELSGTIVLRIPTSELSNTIERLKSLAVRVPQQHLGTEDVTEEYSDVAAQLRNLRALETELVALLADVRAQSSSADEVLVVFERIRSVRSEIERLEGRQQVLDDLIALATVEVRIQPTETAIAVAEEGWRPGDTVAAALRTTVGALQQLADAAIWVAVTALPLALVVLLPLVAIGVGLGRWRRSGDRPAAT